MIMRKGKKVLARDLLYNTFEHIKRIQIQKYHKAPPEEKESVELNPVQILYKAFENSKPVLQLVPCKKGGTVYQVTYHYYCSKMFGICNFTKFKN